ncbi:hypothetical protein HZA97_09415 [Candidatus Woesearchaeota archaeon]|nr:hypothetical protein [Candidatus Woesearchaeota archaeon]
MKKNKKINVWKIISIVCIALFFLILLGKFARLHSFRSSFSVPSEDQVVFAKYVVAEDLIKKGDNIAEYEVRVDDRIRKFGRDKVQKNMIQVYLSKNSTRQTYLLNVEDGEIVMRSITEFYGKVDFPDREHPGREYLGEKDERNVKSK